MRVRLLTAALVTAAAYVTLHGAQPRDMAATTRHAMLERDALTATVQGKRLDVAFTVHNPDAQRRNQRVTITLADYSGETLASTSKTFTLEPGANACQVPLKWAYDAETVPQLALKYSLSSYFGGTEQGARRLVDALPRLDTRVVGYREWLAGSAASLRVVARNAATSAPAPGAQVRIALETNGQSQALFKGATDAQGTLNAAFTLPPNALGGAELVVAVDAGALGQDTVRQTVNVRRKTRILLTTDKPLYQPGQDIQMRALCLRAADLEPAAQTAFLFEVMDSKGNKVFKKPLDTDRFGIASAAFRLAREVNLGAYTVRAVLGDETAEKTVTVDRYVLPKFDVTVTPAKTYYLPGETLEAQVQADYFFGKPVAGGRVQVTASKFEIEFVEFATAEGTLDDDGHWAFDLALPEYFAGTPIEQGQASVRLEVVVVDTADHHEEQVVMTPVAAAPLTVHAVPESGALVPGLENRIYLMAAYPDGSPAEGATLTVSGPWLNAAPPELRTDRLGMATLTFTPPSQGGCTLHVTARDTQGREAAADCQLDARGASEGLILRTNKVLYEVGERLEAAALASKPSGTVYFDVIRHGQTVLTQAAPLEQGKAAVGIDLDAGLAGSIVVQAYVFTGSTDIVRDARALYVNPADALAIEVERDRDVYRPGEPGRLTFRVANEAGQGVPAALGLAIVDESVFALQEVHPGLEKVYFTLEQEIMKPRYELHGYSVETLITRPGPAHAESRWTQDQQQAARVLLASAPEPPAPTLDVATGAQKLDAADAAFREACQKDLEHIHKAVQKLADKRGEFPKHPIKALVRDKRLRPNELMDPLGNPYLFDFSSFNGGMGTFTMMSWGPDGVEGTGDDLALQSPWPEMRTRGGRNIMMMKAAPMAEMADAAIPPPAPAALQALGYLDEAGGGAGASGGEQPVRVREYFPETLLFEPALLTDAGGVATLDLDFADSITTWRMTAMASSLGGALGSTETPLRVFQDFFVDLDLPVTLTQNDRVSIPVVAYNYLDAAQAVRLKFETAPWFELDGPAERVVELESGAVRSLYFPIRVKELGKHKLTVYAYGASMSDAIRREIEVLPDGEECLVSFSDRLEGRVAQTVALPESAIDGASTILVRIYPGMFSQIVDGLDSMLRMPSGCFEQTTSSTYPNILIVQYMAATEQINPEIQMKAEGFINAGYQRLLAYEVDGGGFSWFGDAPANKALTAWGLREFYDMAAVHEVDPAVIARTRQWLLAQQEADGAWKPDASYLHAESWAGIQGSTVLVTAYILDAILATGEPSPQTQRAIDYLKAHWEDGQDAYTLALAANAFVSWNPKDAWTTKILDALYAKRVEEDDVVHWKGAATVTFAHGNAADVETTALAAIALLRSGRHGGAAGKAMTYLIQQKSAQGHWGSTQATILALQAMMTALEHQTEEVDGAVTVALDGEERARFRITPADSDVMRLIDLREHVHEGACHVALELDGEGSMLYQVVGRYYTPWTKRPGGPREAMTIDVEYDKTELAVNDLVEVTATVTNLRPAAAQMIIVDLGVPPGFRVVTPDLEALVEQGVLDKYELTGRQIIAYFDQIGANATIAFSYHLQAQFPLRAKTPPSRVYEYYNPDHETKAAPQDLVVE